MKIGRFRVRRKALSPVIATLLMVAIAVAAAIITYVWSMGLLGGLMGTGGQQTKEQLVVEAYDWKDTTKLVLAIRNVGSAKVDLAAYYLEGKNATLTDTVNIGSTVTVTISGLSGYSSGAAYGVKIVTKTGGTFAFSVVCGKAG